MRNAPPPLNGLLHLVVFTEAMARIISQRAGTDLFEVEALEPYPLDYRHCLNRVRGELDRK
ncbi:MAG: hypothetical protein LBR11_10020 [Deltaproteobacteria bacterium]|jgi:hypothetical protein|nr:hypothetical protein [Deltaproteobacteria bacterium]